MSNKERFLREAAKSLVILDWFIEQIISDEWLVKLRKGPN